ncbi:hypothetical protein KC343_g165 [Hortaea werneckii]|nr:hypothetical protein KC352_g10906 [Hortaea werneckii]KAI7572775.1 hypothetical protein KC317_g463 [Hortaea werneckii]KAI7626971.1 hypothetical protein KC346_g983 [Hortaea werneckii]KAI7638322.1 hypothetical protein KC343_g165 [Hortaea werneckii]KAI7682445.1 hypothetical protein KC319_g1011 [Hortaea werneckii]
MLLVYFSSACLALIGYLRIDITVTTQTALNTGELAIPRNRYAMLQLQISTHSERSPQTAIKLKNEIQSSLAQGYVQRLSNDSTFAACEGAMQPERLEQMQAVVEFIREKPTAFVRAGFDFDNQRSGQDKYAVTLTRVTKGVIDHDGGDVTVWLDSWKNAMEGLEQDERRCQHKNTFIHRIIAINASARLAEKLQQEVKNSQLWELEPQEKDSKLRAMYHTCRRVTAMMYTPDTRAKAVNVPSNCILRARLAAVTYAFRDLIKTLSDDDEEEQRLRE